MIKAYLSQKMLCLRFFFLKVKVKQKVKKLRTLFTIICIYSLIRILMAPAFVLIKRFILQCDKDVGMI